MDDTTRISFYSFKGGAGRSTGMANVAYALADEGYRVGCIDFDVEAAGLNYIFDIPGGILKQRKKVQHYLIPSELDKIEDFSNLIVDIKEDIPSRTIDYDNKSLNGELYVIPAGIDAELTGDVPETENLLPVIGELFEEFSIDRDLDYLLVDSRSGMSNFAMPTLLNVDIVALFFRFSVQHKNGTHQMIDWFGDTLTTVQETKLHAVASSVPEPDQVTDEEIVDWINDPIRGIGKENIEGYTIVRESDTLKLREQILVGMDRLNEENGDKEAAQGYKELARNLSEI